MISLIFRPMKKYQKPLDCGPSICSSVDPPRPPKLARTDPGAEADALAGHPAAGPGRKTSNIGSRVNSHTYGKYWKITIFHGKNYDKLLIISLYPTKEKMKHHEELMKIDTMALSHIHVVQ